MQQEVKVRWDFSNCTLDGTETPLTTPMEISSQPIESQTAEPTGASGPADKEYQRMHLDFNTNEWFINGVSQGQMKNADV